MNYNSFRTAIANAIDSNGVKAITGKILQDAILSVIDALDLGSLYLGEATTTTRPSSEANGFYLALQTGTYTHFQISVAKGEVALIVKTDSRWKKQVLMVMPYIDPVSKHWIVNGEDSGVLAEGQQGQPGTPAESPFKGWFNTDNIPTTGQEGDYCYVDDDGTTKVWRWNPNAEPPAFEETADIPDTDHTQTFASNESVNQVAIDGSKLVNPVNTADPNKPVLAKAEDVMQLKAKLEGVTASEEKIVLTENNVPNTPGTISGVTGDFVPGSSSSTNRVLTVDVTQVTALRFLGLVYKTEANSGFAFWDENDTPIWSKKFDFGASSSTVKEYRLDVPKEAKYFKLTLPYSYSAFANANFYCYTYSGASIKEDFKSLDIRIRGLTFQEEYVYPLKSRVLDGKFVNGDTGALGTYSDVTQGKVFQTEIDTDIVESIRFLGRTTTSTSTNTGYALGYYEDGHELDETYWHTVYCSRWELVSGTATAKEIILNITDELKAAKYFRTCYVSATLVTVDNFYCYLQRGIRALNAGDFASTLYPDGKNAVLGKDAAVVIDRRTRKSNILSKYVGKTLSWTIHSANNVWESTTYSSSTLIYINKEDIGKTLKVVKDPLMNTHFAFLKSQGTLGETPPYADGTGLYLLTSSNGKKEISVEIPADATIIYVKLSDGTTSRNSFGPKSMEIISSEESIVASNMFVNDYEDTYIEEDNVIGRTGDKLYRIKQGIDYRIILSQLPDRKIGNGVDYLAEDGVTVLGSDYSDDEITTETLIEMEALNIPNDCVYIRVRYSYGSDSTTVSRKGIGALMKPLVDDGSIPTNKCVYCVSKIYTDAKPTGYDGESSEQLPVWSAWAFMLPLNTSSFTHGKKFPVVSWFHGSSTGLSPDHFGNYNNFDSTSMPFAIRQLGCIVFDINGYGISYKVDDKARHWGCPMAVATAKRAYEIIVNRFNGKRGFLNCGWSMGGAIAKSYAMTYPEDVIACALFAPSEIGGNGRFHNPESGEDYHVSEESMAHAWGYASYQDMYADHTMSPFVGYSPCVKPHVINQDGTIRKIQDNEFLTSDSISENLDIFVGNFPVEVRVWAGTADDQVPYYFAPWFVNTVRNAGGNATLRTCVGAGHSLFADYKNEILSYFKSKIIK